MNYEAPTITELGTVAEFTRGDKFAIKFDGMSLAEAVSQLIQGASLGDVIGTS
jgi:hypothetical protein